MLSTVEQKAISLKLPVTLLEESTACAESLDISRSEYIREAIERMNRRIQKEEKDRRMAEESLRVREHSMEVNAEFDAIDTFAGIP